MISKRKSGALFPPQPTESIPIFSKEVLMLNNDNSARAMAYDFYQQGAKLINKGKAYQNSMVACSQLLLDYAYLPKFTAHCGSVEMVNPLHPVMVIKVALDHMPANEVFALYVRLKEDANNLAQSPASLCFPNQSTLYNSTAFMQLLRTYILKQPRFDYLSEQEKTLVDDPHNLMLQSYFFIAGHTNPTSTSWEKLDEILERVECSVPLKLTDAQKIFSRMAHK